jgi:hypothetical protein
MLNYSTGGPYDSMRRCIPYARGSVQFVERVSKFYLYGGNVVNENPCVRETAREGGGEIERESVCNLPREPRFLFFPFKANILVTIRGLMYLRVLLKKVSPGKSSSVILV